MTELIRRLARRLRGREWLPAVLWGGAILGVSSLPSPDIGGGLFPGCDKLAHFIEYSILGGLMAFWAASSGCAAGSMREASGGRVGGRAGPKVPGAGWLIAGAIVFAGLDEVHQRLIPGRQMDLWDFSADTAGVVVGFILARRRLRRVLPAGPDGEGRIDG